MKNKWILLLLAVALAVGLGLYFTGSSSADEPLLESGRLYAASLSQSDTQGDAAATVVQGRDFSMTASEFESMSYQNEISEAGADVAQKTLGQFITRRAVYSLAAAEGYAATDEGVQADLDATRAGIAQAENAEDFYTYLEGTGMTEDAYWASMFESTRMILTLERYAQLKLAAYLEAGNAADGWEDYCYCLTRDAVDAQSLTFADGYAWETTEENYNVANIWPNAEGRWS